MSRRVLTVGFVILACFVLFTGSVFARAALGVSDGKGSFGSQRAQRVAVEGAMHQVGQLVLAVSNTGTFSSGFFDNLGITNADVFTGEEIPAGGCEYPKGSDNQYCFAGSFWIGAVIGRDTLVSTGADGWIGLTEMFPDVAPFGRMQKRSLIANSPFFSDNAVSEEDYIAVYTDTFIDLAGSDPEDGNRPHRPLHVQVTQNSYAWSYSYAEDFVLFDYQVKNIGTQSLRNVYMGVYVDADVTFDQGVGFDDDICGFVVSSELERAGYQYTDTVFFAWIADNDGELDNTGEGARPLPALTGTRIVRTPAESLDVSFNWWISNGNAQQDFGPRERPFQGRWKEPFRDFGSGGTGTPVNDRNKYYTMRNREFDYDQIRTASISPSDTLWLLPPANQASDFADGFDTRYLLSFGPFNIAPGQTLPLSFAYIAGEELHSVPSNADDNLPDNPDAYYANLSFDSLAQNAAWASWIYDNPGVDTDSDGYRGPFLEFVNETVDLGADSVPVVDSSVTPWDTIAWSTLDTLQADTIYTAGDDIPDFRGASPPPPPDMFLEPSYGKIKVTFNGLRSETTEDVFSDQIDFEGYRIYIGRDNRTSSYSLVTSYDVEDYNVYEFVVDSSGDGEWELQGVPLRLQELRDQFDDQTLDPNEWTQNRPLNVPVAGGGTRRFYFDPQDYNVSGLGGSRQISKVYPDEPFPSTLDADEADSTELTPEGRFKYFEYEYTIDSLLPSVPYYVAVTTFDFGSPSSGLEALETSVTLNAEMAYPLATPGDVDEQDLEVFVYPNPYRIDAGYRELGFEGRGSDNPPQRTRAIHFANLPPKCTIRIFTLDGDLVREIDHDMSPNDPNASHDEWDLITRNTQMVVSGLYYWTVEEPDGETQIGKLAIIM